MLLTSACTQAGIRKPADPLGTYAKQIEGSKEKIEEGVGKIQGIVDEVMKLVPAS
jgi:hypothetical protein